MACEKAREVEGLQNMSGICLLTLLTRPSSNAQLLPASCALVFISPIASVATSEYLAVIVKHMGVGVFRRFTPFG